MIRYKLICENNVLICEKKDRKKISFIRKEIDFVDILNEFIDKGYTVTIDSKNMILTGKEAYFFIQDFNTIVSSPCLRRLRDDVLQCMLNTGYTMSSDKKSKRKRKLRDKSIMEANEEGVGIKYLSVKKNRPLSNIPFKTVAAFLLLVSLGIRAVPWLYKSFNGSSKSKQRFGDITNGSIALHLDEVREGIETTSIDELVKVLPTPEPTAEVNHEAEYREAIYNFLVKEKLTLDQFSKLLTSMVEGNSPFGFEYQSELDVFLDLCFRDERSYEEKMAIIMVREDLSFDELDTICSGCVAEAFGDGNCYEDAYAVASTLVNRVHDVRYVANHGSNLYDQFTAPGQYDVYKSERRIPYVSRWDLPGYQAVIDALYTEESMHRFLEFRGSWVDVQYYHESFVKGGNQYLAVQSDSRYLPEEQHVVDKDEVMSLTLKS